MTGKKFVFKPVKIVRHVVLAQMCSDECNRSGWEFDLSCSGHLEAHLAKGVLGVVRNDQEGHKVLCFRNMSNVFNVVVHIWYKTCKSMCAMASITINPLEMVSRFMELKVGQACLQTSNPDCISAAHTSSCSFVTWVPGTNLCSYTGCVRWRCWSQLSCTDMYSIALGDADMRLPSMPSHPCNLHSEAMLVRELLKTQRCCWH